MKIANLKISGGYASMNESVDTTVRTMHYCEVEAKLIEFAEKLKSVDDILSFANDRAKDVGKVPFSRIINNLCSEMDEFVFRAAASVIEVANTLQPKKTDEKLMTLYSQPVQAYLNHNMILFKEPYVYGLSEYDIRRMVNGLNLEMLKDSVVFRDEFKSFFIDFEEARAIQRSEVYNGVTARNIIRHTLKMTNIDDRSSSTEYRKWLNLRMAVYVEGNKLSSNYHENEDGEYPFKTYYTEKFPVVVNHIHSKLLGFAKDPIFDIVDPELSTEGEVPETTAIAIFNMIYVTTVVYLLLTTVIYNDLTNCVIHKKNTDKFEEIKPEMLKALGLDA